MNDYKMVIQEKAEELAHQNYNCSFYDLPCQSRNEVYYEAMESVYDKLTDAYDRE